MNPSSTTSNDKAQTTNVERNEEASHQSVNASSSTTTQDQASSSKVHHAIAKDHPVD